MPPWDSAPVSARRRTGPPLEPHPQTRSGPSCVGRRRHDSPRCRRAPLRARPARPSGIGRDPGADPRPDAPGTGPGCRASLAHPRSDAGRPVIRTRVRFRRPSPRWGGKPHQALPFWAERSIWKAGTLCQVAGGMCGLEVFRSVCPTVSARPDVIDMDGSKVV